MIASVKSKERLRNQRGLFFDDPLQNPFHSTNAERIYERTHTWRAGEMGPVLRRIPIYRVTTLPNGKEVERLLVCEINGN